MRTVSPAMSLRSPFKASQSLSRVAFVMSFLNRVSARLERAESHAPDQARSSSGTPCHRLTELSISSAWSSAARRAVAVHWKRLAALLAAGGCRVTLLRSIALGMLYDLRISASQAGHVVIVREPHLSQSRLIAWLDSSHARELANMRVLANLAEVVVTVVHVVSRPSCRQSGPRLCSRNSWIIQDSTERSVSRHGSGSQVAYPQPVCTTDCIR